MSSEHFEFRPRFQRWSPETVEELRNKLKTALENNEDTVIGKVDHAYFTLEPPMSERHFWSPHLSVSMEEIKEGTLVRGLYGPRPEVWMGFMFIYFLSGFLVLVILIIGLSQYNLGLSAYILWAIPFILGGVFVLWFSSRTGEQLARPQMKVIHDFLCVNILDRTTDYFED